MSKRAMASTRAPATVKTMMPLAWATLVTGSSSEKPSAGWPLALVGTTPNRRPARNATVSRDLAAGSLPRTSSPAGRPRTTSRVSRRPLRPGRSSAPVSVTRSSTSATRSSRRRPRAPATTAPAWAAPRSSPRTTLSPQWPSPAVRPPTVPVPVPVSRTPLPRRAGLDHARHDSHAKRRHVADARRLGRCASRSTICGELCVPHRYPHPAHRASRCTSPVRPSTSIL